MRKSLLLTALALAAFGASTAAAQDGAAPEQASPNRFTGPRIEATIGYDQTGEREHGNKIRGMRAGAALGYDLAIGKTLTLGVETGIGQGVAGGERIRFGLPNGQNFDFRMSAGHDIDVSARIGARLGGSTLVYGKAGWADAAYRYTSNLPGEDGTGHGNVDNGLRLGLGIEQMLGKHLYAKAEYRYTHYYQDGDDFGMNRHQLLSGLGVRF